MNTSREPRTETDANDAYSHCLPVVCDGDARYSVWSITVFAALVLCERMCCEAVRN